LAKAKNKNNEYGKNGSAYEEIQNSIIKPVTKMAKEITPVAAVVWGLISIILLGVHAEIIKQAVSGEVGIDQLMDLWVVFMATTPLTISIVVIVAMFQRMENHLLSFWLAPIVLLVAIWIANGLGLPSGVSVHVFEILKKDFRPQSVLASVLGSLAIAYGIKLFFSSFILGGFLSWVWLWKMFPAKIETPIANSGSSASKTPRPKQKAKTTPR
jgi:hypothetical protein